MDSMDDSMGKWKTCRTCGNSVRSDAFNPDGRLKSTSTHQCYWGPSGKKARKVVDIVKRIPGEPRPSRDQLIFDIDDYLKEQFTFCAFCVQNNSAAYPIRVSPLCIGLAKEAFGCQVIFPNHSGLNWNEGITIPPGYGYIPEIVQIFGRSVKFNTPVGVSIPMFAVTTVTGTAVCDAHIDDALNREGLKWLKQK